LKESKVNKRLNIIATLKSSSLNSTGYNITDPSEIIAHLESPDMPLYFFTFDIEYTQYVFADPYLARSDPIDHSRVARTYAQYISNLIADEARLNSN
jgi:hypothetical protein